MTEISSSEHDKPTNTTPEFHLHETAYVVGQPWHDTGTFVVLGDEDPHLARFLCDTDSDLWDCPGDGRAIDQRHAEEIAKRWNEAPELRRRVLDLRTVLEAVEETGLIEGHLARVIERTLNHQAIEETTA